MSDTGRRVRPTRRSLVRGVGAAGVAGLAGCLGGPGDDGTDAECVTGLDGGCASYPDDVRLFQGDLKRQAYYPAETVADSMRVDWAVPTNFAPHTAAKSTPLPTHEGTILFGGDKGSVEARTPGGRLEWRTQTDATVRGFHGSPAVVGDRAYLGGYDGAIYGFDVATGEQLWKVDHETLGGTIAVGSSPAFHDGCLYFIVEYGTPSSGALFAIDPVDGDVEYSDTRIWGQSHPSPTIDRETGHILAGSNDGVVYAWTYPDLEFDWEYQAGPEGGPTGEQKAGGEFRLGAQIKGTTAAYQGRGYVGSWDEQFHCIDLSDGTGRWTFDTGRSSMANPAVDPDGGVVYTGSDVGTVWALDAESGEELWSADVGGRVVGAVTITAETVLAGSYDRHLYALDRETGERRWRVPTRGWVTSGAVPVDGRIYVAERATFTNTREGDLVRPGHTYCLSPE
jgi:outer membrane protein assembly factor BamB